MLEFMNVCFSLFTFLKATLKSYHRASFGTICGSQNSLNHKIYHEASTLNRFSTVHCKTSCASGHNNDD